LLKNKIYDKIILYNNKSMGKEELWIKLTWQDVSTSVRTSPLFDVTKNFWDKIATSLTNSKLIVKYNESFDKMSQDELENYIINLISENKWIKEIDLSELIQNWIIHWHIHGIIWNNFPMIEISRLIPNQQLVNVSFLWIKQLNDLLWKTFVDLFIMKLKEILISNTKINSKVEWTTRVVRSNYKHLTFSINKDLDINQKIFWWTSSIETLINEVFASMKDLDMLYYFPDNFKDFFDIKDIKNVVFQLFNIWVWSRVVGKWWDKEKLKSFYMWEISSRNNINQSKFWDNSNYNFSSIIEHSANAIKLENEIVNKLNWKKFDYNWTLFDIVVNWKISDILIKYIRKWEIISLNDHTDILVRRYINYLTIWFDFISPILSGDELENIENINKQISTWIINTELFQKNYKKTLTQKWLNKDSEWEDWLSIFIDIVEMWIMNLKDFRILAWKVNSWEIDENNSEELLKAWNSVTQKLQLLVNQISDNYPASKISLWWDEICIFIPGKTKNETQKIINNIYEYIVKNALKWRIISSIEPYKQEIFDELDSFTKVSKIFEWMIEKSIQKNNHNEQLVWKMYVSNIDISETNMKLITKYMRPFIKSLKINIKDDNLTELLYDWKDIWTSFTFDIDENWNSKSINVSLVKTKNLVNIKIS